MTDLHIEIDGRTLAVKPNQTIIEAADEAGIYIPRFCYHKHLSVAANCRMCLVEVEKSPKALPACATPVMAGMKVSTRSKKTIDAQRAVMEFLLINHPLDCPICDQGGECELQDISMGYGDGASHFDECKRAVEELDLGPLIATEMTRCIHCTRCVRFGDEIAGLRELGVTQRGGHAEISTYVQHPLHSEVSGNIIDLCPVGALTSKPYRFTARAWELQQAASISPHDAFGSSLHVHTRDGQVMRVVPKENVSLNQTWISDRDRFSYTALSHDDRLQTPLIKVGDKWQEASWETALEFTVERLQSITKSHGVDQLAALLNPSSTTEECYLMQKIVRGLGSQHIEHRLRAVDTEDDAQQSAYPGFDLSLAELEACDTVFIIGSHLTHEWPLLPIRFRKMATAGTKFVVLNAVDDEMHFPIHHQMIISPMQWVKEVEKLTIVLKGDAKRASDQDVESLRPFFAEGKKIAIILGTQVSSHSQAAWLRFAVDQLAQQCGAKVGTITDGANSAGAWLAGAISHRGPAMQAVASRGVSAKQMLTEPRHAYILLNVDPALDVSCPVSAIDVLKKADFVLSLSTYRDPAVLETAHVILPVGPFTETSGTYVNAWGEWQSFRGVVPPFAQSRPAWKVLRVLGELLGLTDCQYDSSEAVRDELKALCATLSNAKPASVMPSPIKDAPLGLGLCFIKERLMYRSDGIVRRSQPLQDALSLMCGEIQHIIKMHPETAAQLNVKEHADVTLHQESNTIQATVRFDKKLALDVVWMAAATEMSAGLDNEMGIVQLT